MCQVWTLTAFVDSLPDRWRRAIRGERNQVLRLLLGGRVRQQGTNLVRAGGCSSTLRPAATCAGSGRGCTGLTRRSRRRRVRGSSGGARTGSDQVDRFAAVAIGD